jgi:hypothetical protein
VAGGGESKQGGDVGEATGVVPVDAGYAIVGKNQVGIAVVVDVAMADGLSPALGGEAGLLGDFGEAPIAEVAVEERRLWLGVGGTNARQEEQVVTIVAIKVEDGEASAGSFYEDPSGYRAAEENRSIETPWLGHIREGFWLMHGSC